MTEIHREVPLDAQIVPALDPSILQLSAIEADFLHKVISSDDDELTNKIHTIQKEAYAIWPYPCIRAFHFVSTMMVHNDVYAKVLDQGKPGSTLFLDIGCCMGTDVRKLVYDGYPAANVYACDLNQGFIDLGYKFYGDSKSCKIHFFSDDIFNLSVTPTASKGVDGALSLVDLRGGVTHLYAGALFHLFDETTQWALALRCALLVSRAPGTVIFGRHQGLEKEGYIDDHLKRTRWGHSPESWRQLWVSVFIALEGNAFAESHVVVDAETRATANAIRSHRSSDHRTLYWSVSIV